MKNTGKKPLLYMVVLGIAGIGGTSAYFSSYDMTLNHASVGRNITEIEENYPEQTPVPSNGQESYEKTVWVTNVPTDEIGFNVDCYVRLSVSYSSADIGNAVTLTNLDTLNWSYHAEDGYYYYIHPLKEGESTTPLFTGFSIDPEKVDDTYLEDMNHFEINLYEESVSAEKFEDYTEAWKYYTNPIVSA